MPTFFHRMVTRLWGKAWATVALGACGLCCHAGRPISADDASVLAPGDCQLESWLQQSPGLRQQVLQPGCNFGGRLEWTAGLTGTQGRDSSASGLGGLQLKWVPSEAEVGGFSYGLTLGLSQPRRSREAALGSAAASTKTLTALLTLAPTPQWLLHANAGVAYTADRLNTRARPQPVTGFWAAAADYTIDGRWGAHAEAFGERHGRPTHQVGTRYWVVTDRLQLDGSLGRQPRGDGTRGGERVGTLGLVWVWPAQN